MAMVAEMDASTLALLSESLSHLSSGREDRALAVLASMRPHPAACDALLALADESHRLGLVEARRRLMDLASCSALTVDSFEVLVGFCLDKGCDSIVSVTKNALLRLGGDYAAISRFFELLKELGAEQITFDGVVSYVAHCLALDQPFSVVVCLSFSNVFGGFAQIRRDALAPLAAEAASRSARAAWRCAATALAFIGGHEHRAVINQIAAAQAWAASGLSPLSSAGSEAVALAQEGRAFMGALLDRRQVEAVVAGLAQRPCYPCFRPYAGCPQVAFDQAPEQSHYASYDVDMILAAPHLLEAANDPRVLSALESYLAGPPTIYSYNLWWSFPKDGLGVTQDYHRDIDDGRFVTLFIHLTDVGSDNGPFVYIPKTHDKARQLTIMPETSDAQPYFVGNGYGGLSQTEQAFAGQIERWTRPAGEGVLCDNFGLHRGEPVRRGRRLMLWVRYGFDQNLACMAQMDAPTRSFAQVAARLGDTPRTRWTNRLFFA